MAWLTGWNYRKKYPIPSSGWSLSGDVSNWVYDIKIDASETDFWAGVKADGGDIRVTSSDGTTLLKKVTVVFDHTNDFCHIKVFIPTITSASDTTPYVYYGNSGASSDDDLANTIGSSYKLNMPLDQNYSSGAFADLSPSANNGTNNGTTDVAGQVGQGRAFVEASTQYISIADSDSLSFGNATTDNPFTVAFTTKLTDATMSWAIAKGSSTAREYLIDFNASDTFEILLFDNTSSHYIKTISNGTFTADEGSFIRCVASYDGGGVATGLNLYRNGVLLASTDVTVGTYVAMHNQAAGATIGRAFTDLALYYDGVIDEAVVYAGEWTADQVKVDYESNFGTVTFGGQEGFTIAIADTGTGTDSLSLAALITILETATGVDSTIIDDGTVHLYLTDAGSGADSVLRSAVSLSVSDTGTGTDAPSIAIKLLTISDTGTGVEAVIATNNNTLFFTYSNIPSSVTVEYRIEDQNGTLHTDWTSTNVTERALTNGKSTYKVTGVELINGFQGLILWRVSGKSKYDRTCTLNYYETWVTGYNALPTLSEIEGSAVLAKQTKLDFVEKWVLNKLVESTDGTTVTLYDDDGTTPLKIWPYTSAMKTRGKAT